MVEYDTDYSLRVVPVRVMKSKRTTSMCSSSTRNSHDDSDEVDGRQSSDEDESDDETKSRVNDTPITYEYVYGAASPAYHYKLPKSADPQNIANASTTMTTITSQSTGTSRKTSKISAAKSAQLQTASKKHHHVQQSHKSVELESTVDSSDDEKPSKELITTNQSLFFNLLKTIREFFLNRNNWSVTEESIIIWFGFMFFAIVVGCILHFLMA